MAHKSCKGQIAVLEMNGPSVPQRRTRRTEVADGMRRIMRSTEIPSLVYDVVYGTLLLLTV